MHAPSSLRYGDCRLRHVRCLPTFGPHSLVGLDGPRATPKPRLAKPRDGSPLKRHNATCSSRRRCPSRLRGAPGGWPHHPSTPPKRFHDCQIAPKPTYEPPSIAFANPLASLRSRIHFETCGDPLPTMHAVRTTR